MLMRMILGFVACFSVLLFAEFEPNVEQIDKKIKLVIKYRFFMFVNLKFRILKIEILQVDQFEMQPYSFQDKLIQLYL